MNHFDDLADARRQLLITQITLRYGVTLYPAWRVHQVVVSESDFARLKDAVWADQRIDALGRGYYMGLGGAIDIVTAPDWTCDEWTVRWARLLGAINATFHIRRGPLRWLSKMLETTSRLGRSDGVD